MFRRLNGYYSKKEKTLTIDSENICEYHDQTADLYLCGKVWASDADRVNDGIEILNLFSRDPKKLTEAVRGVYILLVFVKSTGELYVFHDRTTSPLPFYYSNTDDFFFFGTSLKHLLLQSRIDRVFNEKVLSQFLRNGTIIGEQTLLKDVCKLTHNKGLYVCGQKIERFDAHYTIREISEEEAVRLWEPVLEDSIRRGVSNRQNQQSVCMTLSSGFDSNYVLHVVNKLRDNHEPIYAFTAGGKQGANEIPLVQENITYYDDVKLNVGVVDSKTLQDFPDIVWRYEGLIYERGVFLRYVVAKMVNQLGLKSLIGGDGMDQILNRSFYDAEQIQNTPEEIELQATRTAYLIYSYLYSKKNGIMGNSFGIEDSFPLVDDEFIDIAYSTLALNDNKKLHHKAVCKECLRPEIFNNASKKGGATDAHAFFEEKSEVKRFYRMVRKTAFYREHKNEIGEFWENTLTAFIYGLIMAIWMSIRSRTNRLKSFLRKRKEKDWKRREKKMQLCLKVLYLDLFMKLFVSTEYDNLFLQDGITLTLDQLYH